MCNRRAVSQIIVTPTHCWYVDLLGRGRAMITMQMEATPFQLKLDFSQITCSSTLNKMTIQKGQSQLVGTLYSLRADDCYVVMVS